MLSFHPVHTLSIPGELEVHTWGLQHSSLEQAFMNIVKSSENNSVVEMGEGGNGIMDK